MLLNLSAIAPIKEEQYLKICEDNPDLKLELDQFGTLIIMPPTGGTSGNRNAEITYQLQAWNKQKKLGKVFDSSTEFKLPNGAFRSPDAAWISKMRWDRLTKEDQDNFPPLAPDFVIELHSSSDRLKPLQEKMQEYINNGVRLGWLIDPQNQQVEVYRQGHSVEILRSPNSLSGEDILPEFVLDLNEIW
ncbi:Uma2 family endonuclease [Chroogloeocystis siderophila]|jgi:Uma2 family endonuclease|uniref:Putative restriction endonuclease domain-containing protein n=1 Tax=Chroogloeocystis siderophila 5.2 s.c.1 TaxID=247279 RepID=A0A1U7HC56_9CHRO|nr:Uma2 family endonuclease [Chroogloeocystis siderophila]OKH21160.1 hypothetical protein NIES1031_22200 [Chroogloeocystis siderophila 5.2 s.c.1]